MLSNQQFQTTSLAGVVLYSHLSGLCYTGLSACTSSFLPCDHPTQKSKDYSVSSMITLLHLKCCIAEPLLWTGLIRAWQMSSIYASHSSYEPRSWWKYCATAVRQPKYTTEECLISTRDCHTGVPSLTAEVWWYSTSKWWSEDMMELSLISVQNSYS